MKVVTPKEMVIMDRHTIQNGISSLDLMERAGAACTKVIKNTLDLDSFIIILCGPGNNGGDGLVIGRLLVDAGYKVQIFLTEREDKVSENNKVNLLRLKDKQIDVKFIDNDVQFEDLKIILKRGSHLIDAIFGTGLDKRELADKYDRIFDLANTFDGYKTAIDMPSGLRGDVGLTVGNAFFADQTIVIQNYKTGCLLNDGPDYVGEMTLVDIGIDEDSIPNNKYFIQQKDLQFPYQRKKNTHKFDYGSLVVIAGSKSMSGAGIMAMEGALKSGGGLVTCYVPQEIFLPVVSRAPVEALIKTYDCNITAEDIQKDRKKVVLIGPGIGRAKNYSVVMENILEGTIPVVIDADGIHHLKIVLDTLKKSTTPVVITPHFGEFSKLIDVPKEDILCDPIGYAQKFAIEYQVIVVLKGYRTMIFGTNGEVWFNSTGNPGMATGGSGDVLAGMIAGIAGQNVNLFEAAKAGVYYHGAAGDYYAEKYGQSTLTATSIIESLKYVLK
ncbi:MAG: NAD(P)H-hydrate dehydratase [Eubacteriaceae bacterium]|jgi:NAD(P)H-hydrate epimerase